MARSDILVQFDLHGILPTPQRLQIAEILLAKPQHLSAEQILDRLRRSGSSVSKATVYNTLHQFTRAGLLRELTLGPERSFFDTNVSDHVHFYHEDEGRLEDVPTEELSIPKLPPAPPGSRIRQVDLGEYVAPGDTIVTLLSLDRLYLDFTLPEANFNDLVIDQDLLFKVRSYPGQDFKARVEAWNPQLDINTRNVTIRALVNNKKGLLAPGMFTDISLNSRRQTPVLTVPETAIFYNIYGEAVYILERPPANDNDPQPDYRLAARQVDVLYRRDGIAGIQSGLKDGDKVVTSGQLKLYPSLRVAIVDDVPEYQSNSQ